ncbi:MAG: DNA-binding protein [Acidobacteria bacterium]|nr:MAG: DNA-binding protein [Acidobacteriota bacterium]PYQ24719.1 MAG: DNA-binding protein [Acidobacteriota bacterium]
MRIGILGTGDVGQALGRGFIVLGHEVKMGSRSAGNDKAVGWAKEAGGKASAGTFAEAASHGELVVLATLGSANESALKAAGPQTLRGKVVIDATNPLDFSGGAPQLAVGHTDSGGERVQRLLPGARVVKAFNTVGNAHMFRPRFPGGPPDMFICGNDDDAKKQVAAILSDFGWGTADLGPIESSRYLEPMCMAWVVYGARAGTWNHAFKLLRK